jgi:hypothetical protein
MIDELRVKLEKYVIDKSKPEWRVKKLCWDNVEREIPHSLNGEVLLEEHVEDGKVKGWITTTIENLAKIIDMRDNPSKRPDEEVSFRGARRRLGELSKYEFEEYLGYRKYFDKWRNEGVNI